MSVTHLAAAGVVINGRGIQRCAICGEKLLDTKGLMVAAGDDRSVPPWDAGAYVRFDGSAQYTLDLVFPEELPGDLCLALVEM